jgi:HEAT repeat protein
MFFGLFGKKQSVEQLKQKGDVKGLVARLYSKKFDEANDAAKALSEMGGLTGAQELLKLLLDKDPSKKLVGSMHFMLISDPNALPVLLQMINSNELGSLLKGMAVMPLGRIRNPIAVTPLIELYKRSGYSDDQLKLNILMALGDIGGESAREFLFATCSDSHSKIRSLAITALGRTRDSRALPMLQEEWTNWEKKANRSEFSQVFAEGFEIIRGLVAIGGEQVEQFLRTEREAATNNDVKNLLNDAIEHREKIVL